MATKKTPPRKRTSSTPRKKAPVRAVTAADVAAAAAAQEKPKTVAEAVGGSDRAVFVAMQERIAKAIDDPNIRGADLAALSRRLHELRKEIAAIDAREQEDPDGGPVADEAFDAEAL